MDTPTTPPSTPTTQQIPVEKIVSSPFQARKTFDEESIKELSDSMKESGLHCAINVRSKDDHYELISGERRLRAAKLLGWSMIEAKVEGVTDEQSAVDGLIENLQRVDLNPMEEAEGFAKLQALDKKKWTQEAIAKATGKKQEQISTAMNFVELPSEIQENIRQRIISPAHAVEIARLTNKNSQKAVARKVVKRGLNRDQTRKMVDHKLGKGTGSIPGGLPNAPQDPLSSFWADISYQEQILNHGLWGVEFKDRDVSGGGKKTSCWNFWVVPTKNPPIDLQQWFQAMADSIKKEADDIEKAGAQKYAYPTSQAEDPTNTPAPEPAPVQPPVAKKVLDPKIQAMIDEQLAKGRVVR